MTVTLQALLDDPSLFLFEFDGDTAVFQTMTRDAFHRSIFLDARIKHGDRPKVRVPLDMLVNASAKLEPAERRIGWIFHVAQCGSTLLARALDHPGRSLVLREPASLRRLGVRALSSAMEDQDRFSALLRVTTALLGKRWEPDAPVIVKANVPVNFIAYPLMKLDPATTAIMLHFTLDSYVAAILRTEGHVRWTEGVFEEMRLGESPLVVSNMPASAATKAAALWFVQMKAYEAILRDFPAARSLEAGVFFREPALTVEAAADLFGVPLKAGEAEAMAAGDLFQSYSKNPALDYDLEVREAREAEAKQRLAGEIAAAATWARAAKQRHGLSNALAKPLIGQPVPLLP